MAERNELLVYTRTLYPLSDLCKAYFADSEECRDLKLPRAKCSALLCNVLTPQFMEDLKAIY